VPWSLIQILGHPNIVITCSNKKYVVVSALQYLIGVSYAHLVKYYVAVMLYLTPELLVGGLIGPKKYTAHKVFHACLWWPKIHKYAKEY